MRVRVYTRSLRIAYYVSVTVYYKYAISVIHNYHGYSEL